MTDMLSKAEVERVARLARLELDDAEIDRFTRELSAVLAYMAQLNELNTEGIEPMTHPATPPARLRPDEVRPGVEQTLALKNAPARRAGHFQVPKVIE